MDTGISAAQVMSNLSNFAASNGGSLSTGNAIPAGTPSANSAPSGSVGATYKTASGQLLNSAGNVVGGAVTNGGLISYDGINAIPGTGVGSGYSGSGAIAPITPTTLSGATPITLPNAPISQNYNSTISSGNSLIASLLGGSVNSDGVITLPSGGTGTGSGASGAGNGQTAASLEQMLLSGLQPPPNTEQLYEQAESQVGITEKEQAVQDLTNQINAITSKSQADQLSVTGKGEGVPQAIINGQQAEISKEAAIQLLPLQAQLAAAQGNLTLAKSQLDTLFSIKSADAKAQNDYNNNLIQSVFSFASDQEKTALAAVQKQNDENFSLQQNNLNFAQTIAGKAIDSGQASLAAQITKLDPTSPTFTTDLANLESQIIKPPSTTLLDPTELAQYTYDHPDAGIVAGDTEESANLKVQVTDYISSHPNSISGFDVNQFKNNSDYQAKVIAAIQPHL